MLRRAVLTLATVSLGVPMLSGVALAANVTGAFGDDDLDGTLLMDRIYGLGGRDEIHALAGPADVYGGSGQDSLNGRRGNDRIDAGNGLDFASGGPGNDRIEAAEFGFGTDIIGGGDGADTISVADGITDIVVCGDGEDTVYADGRDELRDCENVLRAAPGEPVESLAARKAERNGEVPQGIIFRVIFPAIRKLPSGALAHRGANAAFLGRPGRRVLAALRLEPPSAGLRNMLESETALSGGGKRERCAMRERPYRALLLYFTAPRRESLYL